MATKEEVTKLVAVLAAAFPHANVSDMTYEVYANELADLPFDELQVAARQCLADLKFMPVIAELREKVLKLRRANNGIPDPFQAWEEAVTLAGNALYSHPEYSHPMVKDAVRAIGGLRMLAMADGNDMIAHRARFLECYGHRLEQAREEEALLPEVRKHLERLAAEKRRALAPGRET